MNDTKGSGGGAKHLKTSTLVARRTRTHRFTVQLSNCVRERYKELFAEGIHLGHSWLNNALDIFLIDGLARAMLVCSQLSDSNYKANMRTLITSLFSQLNHYTYSHQILFIISHIGSKIGESRSRWHSRHSNYFGFQEATKNLLQVSMFWTYCWTDCRITMVENTGLFKKKAFEPGRFIKSRHKSWYNIHVF